MKSNNKEFLSTFLMASGWGAMLLSIVFYMFFWRVDNEPGAKEMPGLLWTAVSFLFFGGMLFIGSHIRLIMKKAWLMLGVGWVLCIILLIGAVAVSPVLLLFMV